MIQGTAEDTSGLAQAAARDLGRSAVVDVGVGRCAEIRWPTEAVDRLFLYVGVCGQGVDSATRWPLDCWTWRDVDGRRDAQRCVDFGRASHIILVVGDLDTRPLCSAILRSSRHSP